MDAAPSVETHCEAPAQDVLLRVSGARDTRNWAAFIDDVRHLKGNWIVVSQAEDGQRHVVVLRADPDVSYDSVMDATENAYLRHFEARATFDAPRCGVQQQPANPSASAS